MQAGSSDLNSLNPQAKQAAGDGSGFVLKWIWLFLPFAYLWFHLINNLRLEWATDPQYSYGLVVPLLMIGLLIRRWHNLSTRSWPTEKIKNSHFLIILCAFLFLLYLPTRLIEEATPEWRPIGWLLGIETIGVTLYAIYLAKGKEGLRRTAFPICFFIVAIPWPTLFEHPIIQGLGRMNAAMVVDVLGVFGVPAIQHGNVIEVSTGMVGINDACSGIRSIQSSLMISLFLGEFYFMNWTRRLLLIPAGFILAMAFNLCRASLLTFIAAKKGVAAIAQYHDEAGFTILLACTATLWGVSYLMSLRGQREKQIAEVANVSENNDGKTPHRALKLLVIALIVWIILVETGVALWYGIRESHIQPGPKWSLVLPKNNPTFEELPFTPEEHELLRFDDGKQGQWQESDGTSWQAYYFDWHPGRVAGYLAKRHTPDICLPATGLQMVAGPTLMVVNVHNLELPIRSYTFQGDGAPLQVFQCHWEPGADREAYAEESSRFNLIRGIWAGRGNKGQKVIEIIIGGYDDANAAKQALLRELDKLIKVDDSKT